MDMTQDPGIAMSTNARHSIVALRAHVPDTAFTASTLGTLREGSGAVINDEGLVVTIGYLITEAEEVWLTTHDERVMSSPMIRKPVLASSRPWAISTCRRCASAVPPPPRCAISAASSMARATR
jgi:hypothetical protein